MDPGRIGIGMATTMRSCKERASMASILYAYVSRERQSILPLKRGLPTPSIEAAAFPGPGCWSGAALPGTVPHLSGLVLRRLRYHGGIDI